MIRSMVFSREEGKSIVVYVFFAFENGCFDFSLPDTRRANFLHRYSGGRWLSEILHRFLFWILKQEGLQWEGSPSSTPEKLQEPPRNGYENKSLLAKLNHFIFSSMASRYAFPLLLYIEGYSFRQIAEVLESSPEEAILRIQRGKDILFLKLRPELVERRPNQSFLPWPDLGYN